MAELDPDKLAEIRAEFEALNNALTTFSTQISEAVNNAEGLDRVSKKVAKTYANDLANAQKQLVNSSKEIQLIQEKRAKGEKLSVEDQKKLAILQKRIAKDRSIAEESINGLRREGVNVAAEQEVILGEQVDSLTEQLTATQGLVTDDISRRGLSGALLDNAKSYLDKLDKSGLASEILSGNLNKAQILAKLAEAALLGVVNGMMRASDLINNFQKGLGVSYSTARNMQISMGVAAAESGKLFVTSEKLNKSFLELSEQTGLVANFGDETLVTMTALTDRLGMGAKEAGNLALLARTQGKNTEAVLDNTVATVSALNKQNGVAINAKSILNDISTTSKAITVSLGMNPQLLAEAATEARLLGTTLDQVDDIAGSLLDFEQSISNELAAELILGQQINLEKARSAALSNDLATVSREVLNNEAIMNSFANNNRIAQESAAAAIGISRDALAEMVYKQEILRLGAEGFRDVYGEQAYQQMQSLSAQEKFEAAIEKVKGILIDIGAILAPIIDGFASIVGYLAESKVAAASLGVILTGLAIKGLINAIAGIFSAFTFLGPFAIPAAVGAVALMMSQIDSAKQQVQDGIADSARGPFTITDAYGKMAVTAKGDNLVATPNVNAGSSVDMSETNRLLAGLLNKNTNFSIGPQHLGTGMNLYTYNV